MAAGLPDEVAWHFLRRRRTSIRVQTVAQKRCQMRNKKRFILSCLIISLFVLLSLTTISLPAYATTYYVDASGGNDFNDGLSPETAWRTISKVNSMDFKPGDTILFKRGEIWREQLIVPSSGEPGKPITFGAYGEGEKPKITGADIVTNWIGPDENGVWKISGSIWQHQILLEDGQKLHRLRPSNPEDLNPGWFGGNSNYIYYKPSWGTPDDHTVELGVRKHPLYIDGKSYIKVENLRFEAGRILSDDPYKFWAVAVLQSCDSCEISNCEVHFGGFFGISLNDCTDCVIKDTEVTYIGRRGINIGADCSDITVASCHVHHIGKKDTIHSDGTAHGDKEGIAISAFSSGGSQEPYNITIEHNEIHDIGTGFAEKSTHCKGICVSSGGADSGNITGIIIRYNKIFNCDGRGISLEAVNGDYEVYYNIVFNNGIGEKESGTSPWGGLMIGTPQGTTSNIKVFNNIFWKNDGGPGSGTKANVRISVGPGSTLTLSFKNNIIGLFQDSSGYDLHFAFSGTLDLDSDYNLFYEDAGDKNWIYWNGDVSDFNHVLGNESGYWSYDHSQDSHSKCLDPSFVDPDNGNFHLQVGSPCIGVGTDVGLAEDMEGNPVDYAPDIGAYEYSDNLIPDIKVNGSDGPITLNQSDRLTITIALDNNGRTDNAKWWLAVDTPFDFLFFTSKGWTNKQQPLYQRPLSYLEPYEVFSIDTSQLSAGTYILYFCIDTDMDNDTIWDSPYCDSMVVNITGVDRLHFKTDFTNRN